MWYLFLLTLWIHFWTFSFGERSWMEKSRRKDGKARKRSADETWSLFAVHPPRNQSIHRIDKQTLLWIHWGRLRQCQARSLQMTIPVPGCRFLPLEPMRNTVRDVCNPSGTLAGWWLIPALGVPQEQEESCAFRFWPDPMYPIPTRPGAPYRLVLLLFLFERKQICTESAACQAFTWSGSNTYILWGKNDFFPLSRICIWYCLFN